jgi:hypothetical protein
MATKPNPMAAKLAQTLDRTSTKPAKAKTPAAPPPAPGGCHKLSVSLYDADLTRLDSIEDYMRARGHRISRSQAIKLAIRTAPLDAGLVDALEQIKQDDGRGKW